MVRLASSDHRCKVRDCSGNERNHTDVSKLDAHRQERVWQHDEVQDSDERCRD